MKKINATTLIAFIALQPVFGQDFEESIVFSDFEQKVWSLVMAEYDRSNEDILETLKALQNDAQKPAEHALLLLHICRYASYLEQPLTTYLKQAQDLKSDYVQGSPSLYRCEQEEAKSIQQFERSAELAHLAFRSLTKHDLPALVIWIAYDYIQTAQEAGFYDEAMQAAQLSLKIAQSNQLTEWQGETLGRLALIQNAIGNYEQALETNLQAQKLVRKQQQTFELTANRGYILMTANRLHEAMEVYNELLVENKDINQEYYLIAGINLTGIYFSLELYKENAALTNELMEIASNYQDSYILAYTKQTMAFTLLMLGEKDNAMLMYQQARSWFEANQVLEPLARFLRDWANLLFNEGFHSDAYLALQDSLALQKSIDLNKRRENAMLSNALLTAEQQKVELLQSEQQKVQGQALLRQKQLEQRLTLTILFAALLLGLLSILAYQRLRRSNLLLATQNKLLDYASTHDPLTKVHNRRYFNDFITSKLEVKAATEALLLLIDIDHFKLVNDQHGHQAGDEVLKIISKRLSSRLRETECIIRWGGEEFLIYIDKPAQHQQSIQIIRRILAEVESSPVHIDTTDICVTISIGFSEVKYMSLSEIEFQMNQIDALLYQAKQQGRNRAVGYFDNKAVPVTIQSQVKS